MFFFAVKSLGYDNIDTYIDYLRSIEPSNIKLLETLTFTSLEFEYFSTTKGIEIYQKYIDSIDTWKGQIIQLQQFLDTSDDQEQKLRAAQIIFRLKKQISDDYTQKLYNKLDGYKKKIDIINVLKKII